MVAPGTEGFDTAAGVGAGGVQSVQGMTPMSPDLRVSSPPASEAAGADGRSARVLAQRARARMAPVNDVRGALVLAATPIGDPADAAPRLSRELATAPIILAEDTRRTKRLCDQLGVQVSGVMRSYHEHNEFEKTPEIVERIAAGERVLLVTDAGMPSVSDPGYRLVAACVERDLPVTCVPGPSAVLMALAVSGLPVDRFCFEGFPPRKAGERERFLRRLADEERTMVFFEAPHRLAASLAAMADVFGADRQGAVCRELTKTYEEVKRGGLSDLADWAEEGARGEITLVVSGAPARQFSFEDALAQVDDLVAGGVRLKDACAQVSTATGVAKKALYDAAIAAKASER